MRGKNRKEQDAAVVILTWLAILAASLVAVAPPLGFYLAEYNYLAGVLEAEAEVDAFFVSRLASANPGLWRYEQHRLQDLLERKTTSRVSGLRRVLDHEGRMIADSPGRPSRPVMTRRHDIFDAGAPVGMIEVSASLREALLRTAVVATASAGLGYALFFVLYHAPIRAVREAERRLKNKNEELREINEDLQSFVYSAAHDLRAPLVNIHGFASELAMSLDDARGDRLSGVHAGDARQALRYIETSAARLSALLNAMLTLARAWHRKLSIESVDVGALVKKVADAVQAGNSKRRVAISLGEFSQVCADRAALEAIFGILMDNAVKYSEPGSIATVRVWAEHRERETVFHVRDAGRGISADDLPKLFKMFRRVGEQDTQGAGVGMGLAYTKTLVRRLGGRIWCESEPGEGSLFSFTVPQRREEDCQLGGKG